jgi:D-alanine-D-alanine ligase
VPITISHEGQWEPFTLSAAPMPQPLVDVIFPILHGTYGEDGTIQGLFELANMPYVGAGVLGSAVGMDKDIMKRLFRDAQLPIVDYWMLRKTEIDAFLQEHMNKLPYPVFVKPANLGSSVGISKAHSAEELPAALQTAAEYDRKIVVERGLDAREIELSVLGNDEPIASVAGEIIPSREFYDYTAKYVDDDSRLLIPAPLTDAQLKQAQQMAIAAFKVLECSGMARADLFLEKSSGKFYVNELNTLPGFTAISMYPKMWEASGIPYTQLIDRLITLALERHVEKNKLRTKY